MCHPDFGPLEWSYRPEQQGFWNSNHAFMLGKKQGLSVTTNVSFIQFGFFSPLAASFRTNQFSPLRENPLIMFEMENRNGGSDLWPKENGLKRSLE